MAFAPAELFGGFVVGVDPAFVLTVLTVLTVVPDVRSFDRSIVFGIAEPATTLLDGDSSTSFAVVGDELEGAEVPGVVVAAVVGAASSEPDPPLPEPPDDPDPPPEEPDPPEVEPEPPEVPPEPPELDDPEDPDDDAAIVVADPPPDPLSAQEVEALATICALIMSDTAIARADL